MRSAGGRPVVICAKGLERATSKLLGEVLARNLAQGQRKLCCRSRSFAADVAIAASPAALSLANLG